MNQMDALRAEMAERGLSGYFSAVEKFAKNAIRITPAKHRESDIPVGASKFGGHPDLPAGMDWCRHPQTGVPLSFVAQIDFAQVHPFDRDGRLPDQGMLYFFYDCSPDGMPWGFDPSDADGWKVLYLEAPSALARQDAPDDLEENGYLFGAARLNFETKLELPSTDSDLCDNLDLSDDEMDSCWEWMDENCEDQINKLWGHADPIQGGMELECEYVTGGIYCGNPDGYAQAKARGLDKNAGRWNLLLQVESNENLGMEWGDMGRLYLWITNEDLAARNFEKSWLILQCG